MCCWVGWTWGCSALFPRGNIPSLLKPVTAECFEPLNLSSTLFVAKEAGKISLLLLPLERQLASSALGERTLIAQPAFQTHSASLPHVALPVAIITQQPAKKHSTSTPLTCK